MTQVIMCSMHNYMTPTHTELNLISQEGKKQGNKVGVIAKKKKRIQPHCTYKTIKGGVLNRTMVSSLSCFLAFSDLLSIYLVMFFSLVYINCWLT